MLRVAVCWSGLTQSVTEATKFNKEFIDSISATTNTDIMFDHFCHFWNSNNRYPYDTITEEILRCQFNEIDAIAIENQETVETIINTLQPKATTHSNLNELYAGFKEHFMPYKHLLEDLDFVKYIDTTEDHISKEVFNKLEFFGFNAHRSYCTFVTDMAQFYGFQKSVSLAEQSFNEYDVVLRIRYDVVLVPNAKLLVGLLLDSISSDAIIQNEFRRYGSGPVEIVNDVFDINELNGTNYGIEDCVFWGPPSCMFKLSKNLSNDAATLYAAHRQLENPMYWKAAEVVWLNTIKNKNILCNTSRATSNVLLYTIVRSNEQFEIFKELNFDIFIFYKEILIQYNNMPRAYSCNGCDIDLQKPGGYFVPPDNYVLLTLLSQMYAFN